MASSTGYGLEGKVAIITGATSGIGRACALALAREGCFVTVTGRKAEALEDVSKECYKAGLPQGKVLSVLANVGSDADCERLISSTVDHFGHLDVLVNNAGIFVTGGIETVSMEDYDKQMNINTRAPFLLMKLAIPHLLKTKGNIINMSSVDALRPLPGYISYEMSKAAMDHLTRSAALELAARGVRVNSVNPGLIVTNILSNAGMDSEETAKFFEEGERQHPLRRNGQPVEVAHAVVFLASNKKSSFVTGVTFPVDGGFAIAPPWSD